MQKYLRELIMKNANCLKTLFVVIKRDISMKIWFQASSQPQFKKNL